MFFVHRSNRAEKLVLALCDVVGDDPPDPFVAEPIVVQGRGMERWLSMRLAEHFGVWANPSFPFPRRFLLDLFARNLGGAASTLSRFEPEALTWAIAARLPGLLEGDEFGAVRDYLADPGDAGRLLELCSQIAKTFDDYVVFRPRLIEGWEARCDGSWQSILWRRLIDDLGCAHVAARARDMLAFIAGAAPSELDLPSRMSVFGVSTLAPLYVRFFSELAAHADVHLFVLSPSEQYWADIRERRTVIVEVLQRDGTQRQLDDGDAAELDEVLQVEVGNRLLASLGRLGREFQAVLEGSADYSERDDYEDPAAHAAPTALEVLQSDMLHLRYRSGGEAARLPAPSDDDSVVVSSCHAPMREVEVLQDYLRGLFAADASLRPRDVIVMMPDVDAYAPFIEAVFDDGSGASAIPFRIADRGPAATSAVFDAFVEVLRIIPGRMTSAEVIDLLRLEVIRERFAIDESEIEIVREWVERSGIRWGIDAAHRAEHGHSANEQNTWSFGLRRLLLGYVADEDGEDMRGYAPYGDIDGGDAAVLGRLAELCECLFSQARRLRAPRSLAGWRSDLMRLLEVFFVQDRAAAFHLQVLRAAIDSLVERAAEAGFSGVVDLRTLASLIDEDLQRRVVARGFLTGEVTFCELVPMRTIPFRVVCLIGMNDGAFPRTQRRPEFNRLGQSRRWGDRSLRDDDRYMFLEALLSARERFYVSFVGQDAQAGAELPPSVVVQELLDALCDLRGSGAAGDIVRRHRLHAFSPDYFAADREPASLPVSYSKSAYASARAVVGDRCAAPPFVTRAAAWSPTAPIAVDDFVRFFENPTRAFLQAQMKLYLASDLDYLETREPLDLNDLERWKIGDELLRRRLSQRASDRAAVARLGMLPLGAIGDASFEDVSAIAADIAAAGGDVERGDAVEIDVDLAGVRVAGALTGAGQGRLVACQFSVISGRQELSLWVRHLLLALALPEVPVESRLIGRSKRRAAVVTFSRPDAAGKILDDLGHLYRAGMNEPLRFFASASRAYAQAAEGKSHAGALARARRKFDDDLRDAYVGQAYAATDPFATEGGADERFAAIAKTVFAPLLAARRESLLG